MKRCISILLFMGAMLQLHGQAYFVTNGVSFGGYDAGMGYRIDVLHDPTGSVPLFDPVTQFWLNPVGKTLPTIYTNTFSFMELVDIGVNVFLLSSNAPITIETILSGNYSWLSLYSSNFVFQSGVTFYVGLHSGSYFAATPNSSSPNIYNDPVFGWAKLRNFQGQIQLLDGALVYGAAGIYAGTQNIIAVPEPSTLTFLAFGSLGLALTRCRVPR